MWNVFFVKNNLPRMSFTMDTNLSDIFHNICIVYMFHHVRHFIICEFKIHFFQSWNSGPALNAFVQQRIVSPLEFSLFTMLYFESAIIKPTKTKKIANKRKHIAQPMIYSNTHVDTGFGYTWEMPCWRWILLLLFSATSNLTDANHSTWRCVRVKLISGL